MPREPIPHDIARQWHPTLNGDLQPEQFSAGSSRKVWWLGDCGHPWEMNIHRRALKGIGCPCCINKRVLTGFNDLATTHPELAEEWHPTKNTFAPSEVLSGSNKKVWWLGACGHEWEARVFWRGKSGANCPYCANQKILVGFNDLATTHPELAEEWHPTKNSLTPQEVHGGSNTKYWWLGKCGHEWQATGSDRTAKKSGCRKCQNGPYQSMADRFPDLVTLFHPTKNEVSLSDISYGSARKFWWQGRCGHEWLSRTSSGTVLCPYCRNHQALAGFNDLDTTHPELAEEWHPTKNGTVKPAEVTGGTHFRAWWQCKRGHEWSTQINDRTHYKTGCPQCIAVKYVSEAEKDIFRFIQSFGLNAQQSNRSILGEKLELDIYIPSKKVAIEYNGLYWHSEKAGKTRAYHHDKWVKCKEKGIQLIQVWEDEWNRNPEQVKRMLAHKLGVSAQGKVFARSTVVAAVGKSEAEEFLTENHVQGFASGSYYVGLRSKDTGALVALMVLKKEAGSGGKVLNIIRYATAANVVGGFTKLLAFAARSYKPESFITFADHCVSDGGLYERNGFVADKELPPDYMYVVRGERQHKFGYRLKRFKNDPELDWVEGLTERELADLNGLDRIWDAGKTRYRKTV